MEKICCLCMKSPVANIDSHYVPSSYLSPIIGRRNSEYMFGSSPIEGFEEFHGRESKLNVDPAQKSLPIVERGIFCNDCEKKLAAWESICTQPLLKFTEQIALDTFKSQTTNEGQVYGTIEKLNVDSVRFFFYTIIWRQLLFQKRKQCLSHPLLYEQLHDIVRRHLTDRFDKNSALPKDYPEITLFTTPNVSQIGNLINPQFKKTDPALFFIGPFNALVWGEWETYKPDTNLPPSLYDEAIKLGNAANVTIALVTNESWLKPLKEWEAFHLITPQYPMYKTVSQYLKVSIDDAASLLRKKCNELLGNGEGSPWHCFYTAYKELMKGSENEQRAERFKFDKLSQPDAESATEEEISDFLIAKSLLSRTADLDGFFRKVRQSSNVIAKEMLSGIFHQCGATETFVYLPQERQREHLSRCVEHLKLALSFSPKNYDILRDYAVGLYRYGNLVESHKLKLEAITLLLNSKINHPNESQDYDLGLMYRGLARQTSRKTNFYLQSTKHFEMAAMKHETISAECWFESGISYAEMAALGNFDRLSVDKANEMFNRACTIEPTNAFYFREWGIFLSNLGHHFQRREHLVSAIERFAKAENVAGGDSRLYFTWAITMSDLAQLDHQFDVELIRAAINKHQQALACDPLFFDSLYSSATLILKLVCRAEDQRTELHKAEERFRKVIQLQPRFALSYNHLGNVLRAKVKLYDLDIIPLFEAIELFAEAIRLRHSRFEPTCGLAHAHFEISIRKNEDLNHLRLAAKYFLEALRMNYKDFQLVDAVNTYMPIFQRHNINHVASLQIALSKGLNFFRTINPRLMNQHIMEYPL